MVNSAEPAATWGSNIQVAGSIYSKRAQIDDTTTVGNLIGGNVASTEGTYFNNGAPTGQDTGDLNSRRNLKATTGDFHRFSTSSESGLVAFTPINRGIDFFDYFAGTTDAQRSTGHYDLNDVNGSISANDDYFSAAYPANSVNTLSWDEYSVGARQAKMQVEVAGIVPSGEEPNRIFISARYGGDAETRRQRATRGTGGNQWWKAPNQPGGTGSTTVWPSGPHGDHWFIQPNTLPNGRPCLELDLEKLPAFLSGGTDSNGNPVPGIGADDVTINNSIWIGPNYSYPGVVKANYPSFSITDGDPYNDIALVITQSSDLSAYTEGLTIITPYRVYFASDFNTVPITPMPSDGAPYPDGNWYCPVSIYAPEKRFGTQNTSGNISVDGQIGYLPSSNTAAINPLDLKDGGTNTVAPSTISTDLFSVGAPGNLPPINAMNWLTTIEEIQPF